MSVITVRDLRIGQRASISFRITAADMVAFARLSGDWNPLHTDRLFAASRGFNKPVVYGGLIVAKISRMLGMELPGTNGIWYSLHLDFRSPLFVEEDAELLAEVSHISEAVGLVVIDLRVRSEARTLAYGRAEVLVVGE